MALRALQLEIQQALLSEDNGVTAAIVDAPPLPAHARLAIYRNAYRSRLTEALADTYFALHELLGDETFDSMGELFIAEHPSVHRSVRWYGAELADFLAACPPFAEQPILAEIARFEWALAAAFDAPDATPIDRETLGRVQRDAWPELTFRFHPSVRQLALAWNTVPVWQALNDGAEPPQPAQSPLPVPWLLWRRQLKNYFRSMDPAEEAALGAALSGSAFAQVCSAMAPFLSEEQIPLRAATLIGTWADSEIIVGVDAGH